MNAKKCFPGRPIVIDENCSIRISSVKISKFEILMDVEEDEASFHA